MWVGEPDYMEASWGNVKQANQNIAAASTAHSSFFLHNQVDHKSNEP